MPIKIRFFPIDANTELMTIYLDTCKLTKLSFIFHNYFVSFINTFFLPKKVIIKGFKQPYTQNYMKNGL